MKKGFGSLPLFDGRVDKYDDWRFKVTTFLETEDNFRELLEWTEKLTTMPEQKDLDAWEFEQKNRNASLMNDQLYNFLCLNLKDEALTMVKNMKTKTGVNGVACWWKFNHDCQALTGQRIQALANAIYKPHRVKKYSEVVVAIEKWERDISRFEAATGKIAEETKTFSLRQLVPEELDLLITSNSNTLKTYEQVKAYVNEQVALRRDKKVSGPVPMDVDALADKILAVAQGEGSEGTSNDWTWPEEGCTGAARHCKGPGDGHCATSGTSSLHFADDVTEDAGKLADKLEEIMSFVSNLKGKGKDGKSKGKGKGGKKNVQCWHCGKIGHVATECWQKDAEMEQYRASKGKGKAKGSSKGEWEDPSKGSWSKSSWKGKGNPWGSRKGTYWFDQTNCSSSDGDRAWAFSVEARTAQDSSEFLNPKISCKPKVWETPPGLSPPVLTSSTWDAFRDIRD